MTERDRPNVTVWDLPTRLFHWSLVLLVAINLFFISPRGGNSTVVHFLVGFAIAGLLLFRLIWGFLGSPRSRFADFLRPWPTVRAYIDGLRRFDPPHSIGHNPLGGWMIAILLATLATMIVTGLSALSRRATGPFAYLLSPNIAHLAAKVHVLTSNLLIGLIVVHIAGVGAEWFLTGENLVKAMITGRKRLSLEAAALEKPVAPVWRAFLTGLLAVALAAGLTLATNFSGT
jgi:cytochrome b